MEMMKTMTEPATAPVKLEVILDRDKLFRRGRVYRTEASFTDVPISDVYVLRHAIDALGDPARVPVRIRFTLEAAGDGATADPAKVQVILDKEKALARGFRYASSAPETEIPFKNVYVWQHAVDALGDPDQILFTLEDA
jgi:hypothetical protein